MANGLRVGQARAPPMAPPPAATNGSRTGDGAERVRPSPAQKSGAGGTASSRSAPRSLVVVTVTPLCGARCSPGARARRGACDGTRNDGRRTWRRANDHLLERGRLGSAEPALPRIEALRIEPVLRRERADALARALQGCERTAGVLLRPARAGERRSQRLRRHGRRISSTIRVPPPGGPLYTSLVNGLRSSRRSGGQSKVSASSSPLYVGEPLFARLPLHVAKKSRRRVGRRNGPSRQRRGRPHVLSQAGRCVTSGTH